MSETTSLPMHSYGELVHALRPESQQKFLEELRGDRQLRRVVEQSVNYEHLPITLTMDNLQFVVASMADYEHLKETLEKELEASKETLV